MTHGWISICSRPGIAEKIIFRDRIEYAYNLQPVKPVLDGEPIYEDHPVCFNANDLGTSSAYDVRIAAYHDVFSGAFGHTYGCHDIWQMNAPNRTPLNGAHHPWYVAIDLPGRQPNEISSCPNRITTHVGSRSGQGH